MTFIICKYVYFSLRERERELYFPFSFFLLFFQQSSFKKKELKRGGREEERNIFSLYNLSSFTTHLRIAGLHKSRYQSFWKFLLFKFFTQTLSLVTTKKASFLFLLLRIFQNLFLPLPKQTNKQTNKKNRCLSWAF